MQTFLPVPDFNQSAQILDYRRLGKQRVEARQILTALKTGKGWIHHPATKMWQGYEQALIHYSNVMIKEWINRGYKNTMPILEVNENCLSLPSWHGNESFHASHRSNLLRKDLAYYSKFNWKEENNLPYIWPVK